MIRRLKKMLARSFPLLAGAYHYYVMTKDMAQHVYKESALGFNFFGNSQMQSGKFEPEETAVIKEGLQNAQVYIDVGANVGYYVCLARSLGVKTIAFEPLYENLSYLYQNVSANGWNDIEIIPVGLSDGVGVAYLYGASTGASLIPNWAGASGTLKQIVPLNTLDNIIGDRFLESRLFIKMDIEGAEYQALLGARGLLSRKIKPEWIVEICFAENYKNEINPYFKDIFDLFNNFGYTAYSINGGYRIVEPQDVDRWLNNRRRDFGYVSYLFKQKERE